MVRELGLWFDLYNNKCLLLLKKILVIKVLAQNIVIYCGPSITAATEPHSPY